MSAKTEGIIRSLRESLKRENEKKTSGYDTRATIRRIEDGVAWVHIPGGVDETPVALTIGADVGDEVQVRVSGGRAFLVGNASAPPTDDKYARQVNYNLGNQIKQTNIVMRTINRAVQDVRKIADNTNQYFWHTEEGTDTGAHITEIPQEEFLTDPENGGGNLLARSNGIAVRDGLTELSRFSTDGVQIGKDGESHAVMDYRSFSLETDNDLTYFNASSIRDEEGYVTETFSGDGTTYKFNLKCAYETIISATIDGTETQTYDTGNRYVLRFAGGVIPASGAVVVVVYEPSQVEQTMAYTLGTRSGDTGGMSVGMGRDVEASGLYSHAQNRGTVAKGYAQTAIGQYNKISGDSDSGSFSSRYDPIFIVGNGTSDTNRSDAMTLDWLGNLKLAGTISSNSSYVSMTSGSVSSSSTGYKNLCSLTLPSGHHYLVIGHIENGIGGETHMRANFQFSGITRYFSHSPVVKTAAGGGLQNIAWLDCTSNSATVILQSYSYTTDAHTESGYMIAIPI